MNVRQDRIPARKTAEGGRAGIAPSMRTRPTVRAGPFTTGKVGECCADWFRVHWHRRGRQVDTGPWYGFARVVPSGSYLWHTSSCVRNPKSSRAASTSDSSSGNTGCPVAGHTGPLGP